MLNLQRKKITCVEKDSCCAGTVDISWQNLRAAMVWCGKETRISPTVFSLKTCSNFGEEVGRQGGTSPHWKTRWVCRTQVPLQEWCW